MLQAPKTSSDMKANLDFLREVWDSHFHLDRTCQKLLGHPIASTNAVLTTDIVIEPRYPVKIIGGIMVYSDPENDPTSITEKKGFGVAV